MLLAPAFNDREALMTRIVRNAAAAAGLVAVMAAGAAGAGPLMERIEAGETIRLGFANEIPWAYPGESNEPLGFVNAIAVGVLEEMGYDNLEPVVTDWGGLIPGLKANRFDIITGGMYILNSRCENIAFSEPIGQFGDAFIVAEGNPKGLQNYQDIKESGATFVTGAGFNTVEAAKQEGVDESQIMTVPSATEILAAVRAGRADAGGLTYFTAINLEEEAPDEIDVTDPGALPDWTFNWVGIGFRDEDQDFLDKFNEALNAHLGSEAMMAAVQEYGYTEAQMPGDQETAWVCENR